jgi:hypothetical protein
MSNKMYLCDLVIRYDNPMGEGASDMVYPVRQSPQGMMTLANRALGPGEIMETPKIKDFVRTIASCAQT